MSVFPGVELTVLYQSQEIHILAYNFDIDKAEAILAERNELVRQQKILELIQARELFLSCGFEVNSDLEINPKKSVGLIIAQDIYNNQTNQKKIISDHGHLLSAKEFYDYYQAPGQLCYVERSGVSVEWLIEKFKKLTNDLILAHPFRPVNNLLSPLSESNIYNLIDLGLTGLEIYHPYLSAEQSDTLQNIVKDRGLLFTGGSDFHGKDNSCELGYYASNKPITSFKLTDRAV